MTDGQVLEFSHATKRFGVLTAVDDLSARIEPGAVTAFLGPNGAGKTTSLRLLLGQIRPTSGTATIGGVTHAELRHPLRTIGSVLEEAVYRPRRTAPRQLSIAAKANGIPLSRVDEVLSLVGLQNETETRIGAYSLGMRQRLSVAGALLGDPGALVLDEPANGLDPEGIRWMRLLMRRLADEGRTVLVSSHVLSEIEQIADNVLVLSKGRLVYADSIGKLSDPTTGSVVVDADDRAALTRALREAGLSFDVLRSGLTVHNTDAAAVGAVAASAGLALTTLQQRGPSLEEVFLDLVHGRRSPITGAIPVVTPPGDAAAPLDVPGTPVAEDAEPAESAEAEDAAAEDAAPAEDASVVTPPVAGLFGAAAAVPVVAAGAGAADLFGASAATADEDAANTVAIPTTRREAAEYAAAQNAQDEGEGTADAGDSAPEADQGAEPDGATEEGAAAEAESSSNAAEQDAEDAEEHSDGPSDGEAEALAEEGSEVEAHEGDAAGSEDAGEQDSEAPGESDDATQPEAPAEDEPAEDADKDEPAEGADADEPAAIAAGIALTAPIVTDDAHDEPRHEDGHEQEGSEEQAGSAEQAGSEDGAPLGDGHSDAPLTHAADGAEDEQGSALGSFETAALTIPAEAAAVSFDDLITGVPLAVQDPEHTAHDGTEDQDGASEQHEADSEQREPGGEGEDVKQDAHSDDDAQDGTAEHHDIDDAPTAATTVITTPSPEDEFITPEPSTETAQIAGIEIFDALAEGRTQEIQVILDEAPDDDDDLEDVTQGEIHHDDDPRAAAVSASLAAAARAFYNDDAPSYTPGPTGEEQPAPEHAEHDQGEAEESRDQGEGQDSHDHSEGQNSHDHGEGQNSHDHDGEHAGN
ncbi:MULTISPECIES: ATP-binding cassette domain-containing protein [unclassified Microbacterium]|uniref:ATP-binding cassette domain-containing protein n=1 Tax=unclassified Microbacterium TaxID=2609290 RepID=UPI003017339A